ncbi:hypothetical protein ADUPG1_010782, partial [Aduncisulcus paluster]
MNYYIKKVNIRNFRSYKELNITSPFNPGLNLIVGANGSGKSNLLLAIRFVLLDGELSTIRTRHERHAFIHSGVGGTDPHGSASVTVTFSRRVTTKRREDHEEEEDEDDLNDVILSRELETVLPLKDKLSINGKTVSKQEYIDFLESELKFPRSSPYNVVQQGKVAEMSLMSETELFKLLKGVSGASSYVQKRDEALKKMQAAKKKRVEVELHLDSMKRTLESLSEEQEKLISCLEVEKQRDGALAMKLEMELEQHHSEIEKKAEELRKIEEKLSKEKEQLQRRENSVAMKESELIRLIEEEVEKKEGVKQAILREISEGTDAIDYGDEESELMSEEEEGEIHDGTQANARALKRTSKRKQTALSNYQEACEDLDHAEQELVRLKKNVDTMTHQLEEQHSSVQKMTIEADVLELKQHAADEFDNIDERKDYLEKKIETLSSIIVESTSEIKERVSEQQKMAKTIEELSEQLTSLHSAASSAIDNETAAEGKLSEVREEMKGIKAGLMNINGEISRLSASKSRYLSELAHVEDELCSYGAVGKVREALRVRNLVKRWEKEGKHKEVTDGVLGCVFELLVHSPKLDIAIEEAAKNNLFAIVLKNDDVLTRILDLLDEEDEMEEEERAASSTRRSWQPSRKEGEASFLLLNRIRKKVPEMHENKEKKCYPLCKQMRTVWDKKISPANPREEEEERDGEEEEREEREEASKATQSSPLSSYSVPLMFSIFGQCFLCQSLSLGRSFAREQGVKVVTVSGDIAESGGAIIGGRAERRKGRSAAGNVRIDRGFMCVWREYREKEAEVTDIEAKLTQ